MDAAVDWKKEDDIALITLNRPDRYNVINTPMAKGFRSAIQDCWDDDQVRAIVLTGSGKSFSGGGDIKFFSAQLDAGNICPGFEAMLPIWHGVIESLREIPKPIIAALNGVVAGGGLGLALACDFRIASSEVKFFPAFSALGASPDSSASFFLPRFVGMGRATELFLRNTPVSAEEALAWGMVNEVTPPEKVMNAAMALATELAHGPTNAFARTKRLLNRSMSSSLKEHLHSEAQLMTISAASPDFSEGVRAFVEKRKPKFIGK